MHIRYAKVNALVIKTEINFLIVSADFGEM